MYLGSLPSDYARPGRGDLLSLTLAAQSADCSPAEFQATLLTIANASTCIIVSAGERFVTEATVEAVKRHRTERRK